MSAFEFSRLEELASRMEVAHHVPGRARLKLRGKPPEWLLDGGIENLKTIKGVRSVCVNYLNASAVISYDERQISPTVFESMSAGDHEPLLKIARSL